MSQTPDIVERLRTVVEDDHERGCQMRFCVCSCGFDDNAAKAAKDAINTIEALTAELDQAVFFVEEHKSTITDRIEALQAALRHIADANPGAQSPHSLAYDMALVARQALKGTDNAK